MTVEETTPEFFTAGGTLPLNAPSYVKRPTDDELLYHLMSGEFCYVLTPRQMGKSSLIIRTAQSLQNEGIRSAIVDLTVTGTVESEDQWYKGILTQIQRRLRLNIAPVNWWDQKKDIPNIQKFIEFFEEVLMEIKEPIVVFMDEIDTTLKLNFRDDFFAGIRSIFNARAGNPELKRITFVLIGVASPSDLIKDRSRTPFNIGQEIALKPFNRADASLLERGLDEAYPNFGKKILDRVFYWTNGHPYLTQKLCQSAVETRLREYNDNEIDLLVKNLFTSEEASRETNLQFVRDNILSYPERRVILSLYKKLLQGVEVRDNKNSLPQNHLKLSGLARVENGKLQVGNRIYSQVFDRRWVNRYTEVDWRYLIIGALTVIVFGFSFVFYNDGVQMPKKAAKMVNDIPVYYQDERGIQYLAELFRMKPYIFSNDYEYKAKDVFYNLFGTWDEQKELVEITRSDKVRPNTEDYETVVVGLYTSLADVDGLGDTTKLLEVMHKSLEEMSMQDESVYKEIGHWLEARKNKSENSFGDALIKYTDAISLNPQNPATLFERARIYARLGDYENALKDYEQVIAIIPESNIEPTEGPTSTPSITPTKTITPTFLPLPTISFNTPIPTTELPVSSDTSPSNVESVATQINLTPTFPPGFVVTPTPTTTPTVTPIPAPLQPRFITLGQRIAAVRNDIYQNGNLYLSYFQSSRVDFPNLITYVPILTLTPTLTPITPNDPGIYYMFVLDASQTMTQSFEGQTKWDAALRAVDSILVGLEEGANYGLVAIGGAPDVGSSNPCEEPSLIAAPFSASKADVAGRVTQLQPGGGGSLYKAFVLAVEELDRLPESTVRSIVYITGSEDACESQDEWADLERFLQIRGDTRLNIYSEIIIIDERNGIRTQTIADRINSLSENVEAQATLAFTSTPFNTPNQTPLITQNPPPEFELLVSNPTTFYCPSNDHLSNEEEVLILLRIQDPSGVSSVILNYWLENKDTGERPDLDNENEAMQFSDSLNAWYAVISIEMYEEPEMEYWFQVQFEVTDGSGVTTLSEVYRDRVTYRSCPPGPS
jgi:tetratricopeptide (TPR) repeat protein